MLRINENLPGTPDEFNDHLDALMKLRADKQYKEVFDHLYDCLSILDTKSASLLAFNALVLVVYTINFTQFGQYASFSYILLYMGLAFLALSASQLLLIVWVRWSDLDNLQGENPLRQHALKLIEVRKRRTIRYRWAWWFSIVALVSMLLFVISVAVSPAPPEEGALCAACAGSSGA